MKRSVAALRTVSVVFCVLLLAVMAQAQYRASIQGVVTDPQGAVVANARVTLTDLETNRKLESTSNANGVYTFNTLPPSRFRVEAEKTGFKKKVIDNVQIIAEQENALNIQLEVGAASETVTVNGAEAPLVDTETATLSGTVSSQDIQKLPSFGRDVFQLAQLAPGAFGDGAQSGGGGSFNLPGSNSGASGATDGIFKTENAPQIIANGTQLENNNITIDGVGVTSVTWGGAAVVTPNEESVKEVKVVTNGYDAENGRYSGAAIQVISNNGTNQYHGSFFFKAHRPGLDAYQTWNGPYSGWTPSDTTPVERGLQRNNSRFNQLGGSVGGPIWKNKIFGFFSWETLRNNSISTGSGWYDTPQFDALAPTGSIAAKLLSFPGEGVTYSSINTAATTCANAGLSEGVNCNTISGQGLNLGSPLTSALGTPDPTWVSSGTPGVGSGLSNVPDVFFVNTVNPTTVSENQYNVRIDFNISSRDLVAFSTYQVPAGNTGYNGPNRSANLWHHKAINDSETALWNHTFSPTLLNEARMNAAGWRWNEINTNSQEPWGLPDDNIDGMANIGVNSFGAPGPSVFDQWTYNVTDKLTKVYKSHLLKFGGQLTRLEYLDEAPWSARPDWNFRNLWDLLNDAPYAEGGNFNPLTGEPSAVRKDLRQSFFGLFVQDDYKLRPNLTINIGLRWDYFQPLHDKAGEISVVQLGTGSAALTGMNLRQGGDLYSAPKDNFGPQLGFAWSPTMFHDKTVVRGGVGVAFNALEEAITTNGRFNPPLVSSVYICCAAYGAPDTNILYAIPSSTSSFFGYPVNPATVTTFGSNNLPVSGAPVGVTGFPAHLPTGYTYRYSLEVQEDLGHQWVATLGYQGSTSHHLTRQYNENWVYAAQGVAMNPFVSSVDWYADDANANFNALLAGVRHQFARSFEVDAQYRWARSMDDGSQPYYEDPYQYYPQESWGRSDYDVKNAFKLYGVWSPTIFHGSRGWLEKAAGGWSLSGILNVHSGFPWTPAYSNGTNCNLIYQGSGDCTLRPAAYLGGAGTDYSDSAFESGPGPSNPTAYNKNFSNGALAYFTIPTFVTGPAFPATGPLPQNSLVKRNSLIGPGYFDTDMSLNKAFGLPTMKVLGEGAKLEFRIDFFNLFNKLNLNGGSINNTISYDGVTSNPAFGQAQNALGSRTIEMQARFDF